MLSGNVKLLGYYELNVSRKYRFDWWLEYFKDIYCFRREENRESYQHANKGLCQGTESFHWIAASFFHFNFSHKPSKQQASKHMTGQGPWPCTCNDSIASSLLSTHNRLEYFAWFVLCNHSLFQFVRVLRDMAFFVYSFQWKIDKMFQSRGQFI